MKKTTAKKPPRKTNLPTFGWLDAYKSKKIERDAARKERQDSNEIAG
jgi:hypothetical protein